MTKPCRQEILWFLDILVRIHVPAGDGSTDVSVMEHIMPQGFSPPLHIHHSEDEVFFMLAGEVRFQVGDQEIMIRPGDTLMAPKGIPHSFVVTSRENAHWLVMTRNGDFERMVRMASRPAERNEPPPRLGPPTPEQAEALDAACRAHQIELIGPPLALAA